MIANTQIVSILGGPGSGKGTQCALLQQRFLCAHLSVGDVLRAEAAKPDSVYASIIAENMRLGRVGPKEITVDILQTHMEEALDAGVRTFFLDGFPRKLDQAEYFTQNVAPIERIVVFECPQSVLVERLSMRCRADDNPENIMRRIDTFRTDTSHVLEKFSAQDKIIRLQSDCDIECVFAKLQEVLESSGVKLMPRASTAMST